MEINLGDGRTMTLPYAPIQPVVKSAKREPSRAEVLAYIRREAFAAGKAAGKLLAKEQAKAAKKAAKAAAKARPARTGSVRKFGQESSNIGAIFAEVEATRSALNLLDAQRRFEAARGSVEKGAAGQALTLARLAAFNGGSL